MQFAIKKIEYFTDPILFSVSDPTDQYTESLIISSKMLVGTNGDVIKRQISNLLVK